MTSKTCSESVRTTMLMGSSPRSRDLESLPEHVVAINPDGVQSGGDRRPFDRRNDCGQIADHRFGFDTPDEAAADIAFVDERSDEHTSELQSLMRISYAVYCLKKKTSQ